MAIADDFRTMPEFVSKTEKFTRSAPLRHEINEVIKNLINSSSFSVDHLHDEMNKIFPGTDKET
jgi:hypothetical protein